MSDFTRKHAAVIGINAYAHGIATLRTAVDDARAIASTLEADHGYTHPHLLLDASATRSTILDLLEETLPAETEADSALLLYFAGHGVAHGDGSEGPQGFLLPQDAHPADESSWLEMQRIRKALAKLPCRHLLVVLDCCFAGSFRWASSRHLVPVGRPLYASQYARFVRGTAWQVLTSASHNQEAMDVTPGRCNTRDNGTEGHSPFAAALLAGLAGAADSSRGKHDPDGVITATELYQYVFEELVPPEADSWQTPGLWPLKPENMGEFVFRVPGQRLKTRRDPPLDGRNNPWIALKAYGRKDAPLFFGRERVVREILDRLRDDSQPLLAVVGASGTGKSSVVKAGVLPRLEKPPAELADTVGDWRIVRMPRLEGDPAPALEDALRRLKRAPRKYRRLLFFDQFEELYTQCRNGAIRKQFLGRLAQAMTGDRPIRVLLTLRSDFQPRLARCGVLAALLTEGCYGVPGLTVEEFREIIEKPAESKALYFEPPELVDELVDAVTAEPGGLPLLSFTLSEMYRQAQRRRRKTGGLDRALTRQDYEATGGVVGALHRRATDLYEHFKPAQQRTLRRVFLRLVTRQGGRLARRRVESRELEFGSAGSPERKRVNQVLDAYVDARLLVRDAKHVEPAHDTLVLAWDRLLEWLGELRAQQALLLEVWRSAAAWDQARRARPATAKVARQAWRKQLAEQARSVTTTGTSVGPPLAKQGAGLGPRLRWRTRKLRRNVRMTAIGARAVWQAWREWRREVYGRLWSQDPRLPQALKLRPELNLLEQEFVDLSHKRQQKQGRFRHVLAVATAAVLLGTTVFFGYQSFRLAKLHLQARTASVRWLAERFADHDPTRAALVLREIEGADARSTLAATQFDAEGLMRRVLQAPLARHWLRHEEEDGERKPLVSVAFDAGGARVLTASADSARVWPLDEAGGQAAGGPLRCTDGAEPLAAAAFTAGGEHVAIVTTRGTICLCPLDGGESEVIHEGYGTAAAVFSRDGRWLLTAFDAGVAHLWDLERIAERSDGERKPIALRGRDAVRLVTAAFSRDGQWLAAAAEDGSARVWSLRETAAPQPKVLQTRGAVAVTFRQDGRVMVLAGDGKTRAWSLEAEARPEVRVGARSSETVTRAWFSDSGRSVIALYDTGKAQMWELADKSFDPCRTPPRGRSADASEPDGREGDARPEWVAFSPDARLMAVACSDGTPRIRTVGGVWKRDLAGLEEAVVAAAFSGDGRWVATASADGKARIWNVEDAADPVELGKGKVEKTLGKLGLGDREPLVAVSVNRDGDLVAALNAEGTVKVWARRDPRDLLVKYSWVRSAELAHDRDLLRLTCADGTTLEWRPGQKAKETGECGKSEPMSLAPERRSLPATLSGADQTLTVSRDGVQVKRQVSRSEITPCPESVAALAVFSPSGDRVVAGCGDGTARVWDAKGRRETVLRGHDAAVVAALFSSCGLLATASEDGTVRTWRLDARPATAENVDDLALEALLEELWAATPLCLDPEARREYFLESKKDARRNYGKCRERARRARPEPALPTAPGSPGSAVRVPASPAGGPPS